MSDELNFEGTPGFDELEQADLFLEEPVPGPGEDAAETPAEDIQEPEDAGATPELPPAPPEMPEETESEIADAIASAVAATFHGEPQFIPQEISEETLAEPQIESPADQPEPEAAPEQDAEPDVPEPPAKDPAPVEEETNEAPERSPEAPAKEKTPDRKKKQEPVYHAPAKQKKIPKSRVRDSALDSLGQSISEIRTRQRQDLPGGNVSLKATEKHYAQLTKLCGLFTPARYIVLVLMILALAGRRFRWMLLGFLGGQTGVYVAVVVTIITLVLSWHSVVRAVRDMRYARFSFESLLLVTTLMSLLEAVKNANTETLLPLLAIGWCLTGAADLRESGAKLRALRAVISGKKRVGVRIRRNLWEHNDCVGKAPASTTGFVRHLEERDSFHAGWSGWALPLLAISLIVSAYLTAKTGTSYLTVLTTLLTVSLPVAASLCCAMPLEMLSRALGRKGALAGWFGVKMLSGKKTVLIYDSDLFPKGTITHKGVKVYGNQTPQLLVSYGASLVLMADNGLTEPFTRLLRDIGGQIHHVSGFQVTEGGLSGRINGVFVAVGTYNFMNLMGTLPPQNAPKNGLFIALNGQIAGLFAIKYRVMGGAATGFRRLVRELRLTPLAAMKNLSVNPSYMKTWFKVPVGEIICPKVDTRWKLSKPSRFARGTVCGFLTAEGIIPYSRMVAGARRTYRMGMILTIASILFSLVMLILTAVRISAGAPLIAASRLLLVQILSYLVILIWSRFAIR